MQNDTDMHRNVFDELEAKEREIQEAQRARDEARTAVERALHDDMLNLLERYRRYGVALPQEVVLAVQTTQGPEPVRLAPESVTGPARLTTSKKERRRAPGVQRPEWVPASAKHCKVCDGWTDHDARSHRQESPKRALPLKYVHPEKMKPRMVEKDREASA